MTDDAGRAGADEAEIAAARWVRALMWPTLAPTDGDLARIDFARWLRRPHWMLGDGLLLLMVEDPESGGLSGSTRSSFRFLCELHERDPANAWTAQWKRTIHQAIGDARFGHLPAAAPSSGSGIVADLERRVAPADLLRWARDEARVSLPAPLAAHLSTLEASAGDATAPGHAPVSTDDAAIPGGAAVTPKAPAVAPAQKSKRPGRTEVNALDRLDVLGAAISVVAAFPDRCTFSTGRLNASAIADLVAEHAAFFWPGKKGEPLHSARVMRDALSPLITRAEKLRS